ncbi:MAG: hypothetical protein QN193_03515 [Armatimonadota bacterium]|nr:hypothetical protein [Armatimonadota bacterium]MDR7569658.1 hypothetical protein [Armatimonadota bacterium]
MRSAPDRSEKRATSQPPPSPVGVVGCTERYNTLEMAFTVKDFQSLLRLLDRKPEWKDALRTSLLGEEFLALPRLVQRLVQAQQATNRQIRTLARAQTETERRMGELEQALARLTEAQVRTEERLGRLEERTDRLEQALARLTEAQVRTEEQVRELVEAQRVINLRLGRLEDILGLTIEEHAEDILRLVLREKGLEILEDPRSVPVDTEGQVDLATVCRDPQGRRITVVVEAKARLTVSAVRRWANRIGSPEFRRKLVEAGLGGPYLAYVFGIRMDRAVEEAAREAGLGLLGSRGEVFQPAGLLD